MKRFLFLLYFLISVSLQAADVPLAWDASISPNVVAYNVYVGGASRTYGTPIGIGNVTTYTVTGLSLGTYYFAVTAVDVNGDESDFSNEVSQVIGNTPPALAISAMPCAANWYGVVCLAMVTQNSSAIFRYQKIGTNGWTTIIATPTETKTQHRAVVYFDQGLHDYYNFRWEVTANGVTVSASGTFQTK